MGFKLIGSDIEEVTTDGGFMTQGLGYPLRSVELGEISGNVIMTAQSMDPQTPAGLNIPLQVEFGAPQSTDDVDVLADGTILIKNKGAYSGFTLLYFNRTSSVGSTFFFVRVLRDGVQQGNPTAIEQSDDGITVPIELPLFQILGEELSFPVSYTVEVMRDGQGQNNGGLKSLASTAGWGAAPSAEVRVSKH